MGGQRFVTAVLRRPWAAGILVFAASLMVYAPTISDELVSTDVAASSLTAWQIAQTGQPWMDGLALPEDLPIPYFAPGAEGHTVTSRTPGPIWAGVPFYLGSSTEQSDLDYGRSGLAAATLTAAAVATIFLALRSRMTTSGALGVTTAFALATPMWSVSADALWSHSVTVLGLAGTAWALSRQSWWAAGAWLGVAILGRPHVALIAAVVGLGMAWSKRSPAVAARVGAGSAVGLAILVAWNRYVFGVWGVESGYGKSLDSAMPATGGLTGYLENLAGFLVSPDRGFLVWTPLAVLLLPAVVRSWTTTPTWARWLATGGIAYTVAQLGLNVFGGGDAFYAYRLGLELLVSLTPLYAFSLKAAGHLARRVAPAVVGLQLAAISFGAVVEGLFINQQDVWVDNSLFAVLRSAPVPVGLYLLAVGVVGALVTRRWIARAEATNTPTPGPATAEPSPSPAP